MNLVIFLIISMIFMRANNFKKKLNNLNKSKNSKKSRKNKVKMMGKQKEQRKTTFKNF